MKISGVLILIFLVGCAARPTLEELEAQAMATGDWSAVEKRELLLRRSGHRIGSNCPDDTTLICVDEMGKERCDCLPSYALSGKRLSR